MTEHEFYKMLQGAAEQAEKAAAGRVFLLRKETERRVKAIVRAISGRDNYTYRFDPATNRIDFLLTDYVFDSHVQDLQTVFSLADLITVDADADGRVHMDLCVTNACNVIGKIGK